MSARSIWSPAEADFPSNGSPRQQLGFALKYAALAPTEHDRQLWEFQLADQHVELLARNDPALERIDPDGRELLIGCGTALLYLKLALKHFGCLGRVELFPNLDQPALVARIHFGCCRERDLQEKRLFEAMTASRASSSPLSERPVSETMLAALSHAVVCERGWLDFAQSEMTRRRVMEIALTNHQFGRNTAPSRAFPTNVAMSGQTSRWPLPLFAFGGRTNNSRNMADEAQPPPSLPAATLAVVKTKTDDKHGWLAAGQTMARAVLQAQALGLAWAFFDQVRRREAREALRMGIGHKGFAQVILRFGALTAGEPTRMSAPTTATATFR